MRDSQQQYETIITNKQLEIDELSKTCQCLSKKVEELMSKSYSQGNPSDNYKN